MTVVTFPCVGCLTFFRVPDSLSPPSLIFSPFLLYISHTSLMVWLKLDKIVRDDGYIFVMQCPGKPQSPKKAEWKCLTNEGHYIMHYHHDTISQGWAKLQTIEWKPSQITGMLHRCIPLFSHPSFQTSLFSDGIGGQRAPWLFTTAVLCVRLCHVMMWFLGARAAWPVKDKLYVNLLKGRWQRAWVNTLRGGDMGARDHAACLSKPGETSFNCVVGSGTGQPWPVQAPSEGHITPHSLTPRSPSSLAESGWTRG